MGYSHYCLQSSQSPYKKSEAQRSQVRRMETSLPRSVFKEGLVPAVGSAVIPFRTSVKLWRAAAPRSHPSQYAARIQWVGDIKAQHQSARTSSVSEFPVGWWRLLDRSRGSNSLLPKPASFPSFPHCPFRGCSLINT